MKPTFIRCPRCSEKLLFVDKPMIENENYFCEQCGTYWFIALIGNVDDDIHIIKLNEPKDVVKLHKELNKALLDGLGEKE